MRAPSSTSTWEEWRAHFEAQAARPCPGFPQSLDISPALRPPLVSSLISFQAGETGEGRIARQIWATELPGIDDDYRAALGLFVAEEGRHARILGSALRALGSAPASGTATQGVFTWARRLAGVRLKLTALLAAEVVGIEAYALLAELLPGGPLRLALLELADDERHHLRFHVDFFRTQMGSLASGKIPVAAWRSTWWAGIGAGLPLLMAEHGRNYGLLGASPVQLASAVVARAVEVDRAVTGQWSRAPAPWSASPQSRYVSRAPTFPSHSSPSGPGATSHRSKPTTRRPEVSTVSSKVTACA